MDQEQARRIRRLLYKWGHTLYYIKRKEEEISALRKIVECTYDTLRAQEITDMPRICSTSSGVERAVEYAEKRRCGYEASAEMIQQDIEQALEIKRTIDEVVDGLQPVAQKVLRMRYVDDHRWQYIATALCYEERAVRKIEAESVKKLSEILKIE